MSSQMITFCITLLLAAFTTASPISLNDTLNRRQSDTPGQDRLNGANFPDPCIYIDPNSGAVTAAGTQGGDANVQHAAAQQFGDPVWSIDDTALLPTPPGWATGGYWAPSLGQLTDGDGSYYMYYSAYNDGSSQHCLGLARNADTITGPFSDGSESSWICPTDQGGAIDPAGFLDTDGTRYIVYKIDGQAATGKGCGPENPGTPLMLQQTTNDGYTLVGDPIDLQDNAGPDDQYNIEAPSICRSSDGTYFLFFSSNCFDGDSYTVSYVSSTTGIKGPYGSRATLLATGDQGLNSPGGADVLPDCSKMVFHADLNPGDSSTRTLHAAYLSVSGTTVTVQ